MNVLWINTRPIFEQWLTFCEPIQTNTPLYECYCIFFVLRIPCPYYTLVTCHNSSEIRNATHRVLAVTNTPQHAWRSVADNVKRIILCALWVVIFNVVCSICVVALYDFSTELYGCDDSTHPSSHPPIPICRIWDAPDYGVVPGRIGSGLRSGKFLHIHPVRWWFCVVSVTGGHDTCGLTDRKYRHAHDELLTNTWLYLYQILYIMWIHGRN